MKVSDKENDSSSPSLSGVSPKIISANGKFESQGKYYWFATQIYEI